MSMDTAEHKLVRLEIGCGAKKSEGYIGVDRFPFHGVDIVADIDKGLPFADNFADVVYAQHSLEHFKDLTKIMQEIYRVCKHKALVMILAPYYFTTTNISNVYHHQHFTEDTLRFFSTSRTSCIDPKEIECPHAAHYGLGTSDNSAIQVNFEPLALEFFYFPGYRHLPADQKRTLRRSFLNVCDQYFVCAVVNKKETPLSDDELAERRAFARTQEPSIITSLRRRDQVTSEKDFTLSSFLTPIEDSVKALDQDFRAELNALADAEEKKRKEIVLQVQVDNANIREELLQHLKKNEQQSRLDSLGVRNELLQLIKEADQQNMATCSSLRDELIGFAKTTEQHFSALDKQIRADAVLHEQHVRQHVDVLDVQLRGELREQLREMEQKLAASRTQGSEDILSLIRREEFRVNAVEEQLRQSLARQIQSIQQKFGELESRLQTENHVRSSRASEELRRLQEKIEKDCIELRNSFDRHVSEAEKRLSLAGDCPSLIQKEAGRMIKTLEGKQVAAFGGMTQTVESLGRSSAELMRAYLRRRRVCGGCYFYDAHRNIDDAIFQGHRAFYDSLLRLSPYYTSKAFLSLAAPLPFVSYEEYSVSGKGSRLTFFVVASYRAKLFVEYVAEGKIVGQQKIVLEKEGPVTLSAPNMEGLQVRFKVTDTASVVRLLEIERRYLFFLSKRSLAAYLE